MLHKNKNQKAGRIVLCFIAVCLMASGCGKKEKTPETKAKKTVEKTAKEPRPEPEAEVEPEPQQEPEPVSKGITIVIDPGHSAIVENKQEPVGPGATELKSGDTSGTSGVNTGINEYEFTLNLANQLKAELETRGYTIVLTRDSNDVPRSCVERADIMNNANAQACVRIHANGSENSGAKGAMTICTSAGSPYVPELYQQSRFLSDCVLEQYIVSTGAVSEGVWETDTMSGNNWSKIPVTIIETGYMSNPEEDALLASQDYQIKMVQGIANGLDKYFE